jgi:hypothetical protein
LTTLALAVDPSVALAADAVCLWDLIDSADEIGGRGTLPEWYMPAPMAGARPARKRWHRLLAAAIIVSFLLIDALGLCITYGQLVAA